MIVQAEHLGVIIGVDINLKTSDGAEANLCLSERRIQLTVVYNTQSRLCKCVNLVNPEEDVPQTIAKEWLEEIQK